MRTGPSPTVAPAVLLLLLVGCERPEVTYYEVPREERSATARGAGAPAAPGTEREEITWTVPPGWRENPDAANRTGSFSVEGPDGGAAKIEVLDFHPEIGTDVDIANFLADRLGIPPFTEKSLGEAATEEELGANTFRVLRMTGAEKGAGVLAAILRTDLSTRFFRMIGSEATIEAEADNFRALLASVELTRSTASSTGGAAAPSGRGPEPGTPAWEVPAGWEPGRASEMRRGSYQVTGAGGSSLDISVTTFGGTVGGLHQNVNRWRRNDLGLGPVSADEAAALSQPLVVDGLEGSLIDLVGGSRRTLVYWVMHEGSSWFFKMTGDAQLVGRERDNFDAFIHSVRF